MPIIVSTQERKLHGETKVFLKIESGYRAGNIIEHPFFISTEKAIDWATETGYTIRTENILRSVS